MLELVDRASGVYHGALGIMIMATYETLRRSMMRLWMIVCTTNGRTFLCVIYLKPRIRKKLLELACGTGIQSVRFSQAGFDVTGLDLSADMLEDC